MKGAPDPHPVPGAGAGGLPAGLPLRFAHRGASARAPENTLAAFREAARLGADAVECDVQLCADGVPVILHDDTVDRTTDGRGAVARLTLPQIRKLDAGAWFASRFRGERIPTLEETLEFARGRIGLNLEVKETDLKGRGRGNGDAALVRALASAVRRTGFADFLVVSSFSPALLHRVRQAMPRARLGWLCSRSCRGLKRLQRRVDLFAFHPHQRLATPRRVRAAHDRGLRVFVWTVNDPAAMRRLVHLGCDGLMTDDPALFQEIPCLRRHPAPSARAR